MSSLVTQKHLKQELEMPKEKTMATDIIRKDITTELYREYDFGGRVYRIDFPVTLYYREGGTTHRVVDGKGVAHCVPIPGAFGCVLRWQNKNKDNPVEF
jgi:hypothetical protein